MRTAALALLALAAACAHGGGTSFRLYRSSAITGEPVHVATFDAPEDSAYNALNCELAAALFAEQPRVVERYWCAPVGG